MDALSKQTKIVLAVVLLAAVVLIVPNILQSQPGELNVGNTYIYEIDGYGMFWPISGDMEWKILDESDSNFEVEMKTTLIFMGERESDVGNILIDKETGASDTSVKNHTETIHTEWGEKEVDVYIDVEENMTTKMYVGSEDGVLYKMNATEDFIYINFYLVDFEQDWWAFFNLNNWEYLKNSVFND